MNYDETQVENIEFGTILSVNQFIGFSTEPIPFVNGESVTISGLSTTFNGYSGLINSRIGIRTDNFVLTLGVGTTAKLVLPLTSTSLEIWDIPHSVRMIFLVLEQKM